jgi:YidC/Oxa1 family membrane protein insertase
VSFLNPLYHAVAFLLTGIHSGLAHPFGANSGASWALSIVLLTVGMRLVLFPVFVKQIRGQRAMQALQPRMKELQAKHKNDKEKLNQEMMALWREAKVNPFSGCLPLVLQIPIFVSLYHTLREIKPISGCPSGPNAASCYPSNIAGFSQHEIFSAAHAKIFGVPISASFKTSTAVLHALGASQGSTRALALILTVLMGASTFITQRQLMARNGPAADSAMAQQQKILLYVFPVLFLVYGFYFPIGVLVYWLTTNVWSMGQQFLIIRRMDTGTDTPAVVVAGPAPGAKPQQPPRGSAGPPRPAPATPNPVAGGDVVLPPGGAISAPPPRPANPPNPRRPTANRSKKRKKGRR